MLQTIKLKEFGISELKAIKEFIEMQNLLLTVKLQELENKPNELLTVMYTSPQKEIITDLIEQNKTFLEEVKNRIINLI